MAKRPTPDYAALAIDGSSPETSAAPELISQKPKPADGEKAQQYVCYLHPAGHRALRLYSLEARTSLQAIIIEALEAWTKAHGIREPIKPVRTK